jgi:hypothetical protein
MGSKRAVVGNCNMQPNLVVVDLFDSFASQTGFIEENFFDVAKGRSACDGGEICPSRSNGWNQRFQGWVGSGKSRAQ